MKTPTPKKTASGYRIQLRLNGASIPVTAPTAKECIRQAELIKAEHRAEKRLVSKNNITLRQAIGNYIAARDGVLSPSTIRGYRNIGKNRFAKYSDERIAKVDWQTAVNEEAKVVNAKTLKNAWGFVSTVIQSCGINPGKITLPQVVPNEHPWLTPEQIPMFLDAIKGKDAEIPALLALHGLRCSEVYALDYSSIKDDVIRVRGSKVLDENNKYVVNKANKTSSSRRDVPIMIPRLSEVIRERKSEGKPLLSYTTQTLTKTINAICADNSLPLVGVHGLRHSFASLCYHAGLTERETMKLGGWSDPGVMRKIYTHMSEADSKKANEKLKDFFNSL